MGARDGEEWRTRKDSNLRPSGPKPDALSTELRMREIIFAQTSLVVKLILKLSLVSECASRARRCEQPSRT